MKKYAFVLLVFSLFAGLASATSVSVSPDNFQKNFVAGENGSKDVTVSWSGSDVKYVSLDAYVRANSTNTNGFNVSLSRPDMVLNPGESKSVTVFMDTSTALKPDVFTVTVNASAKVQYFEDDTGASSSDVEEAVERVRDELQSGTENVSNRTEGLQEKVDELNDTVSRLEEELDTSEPNVSAGDVNELRSEVRSLKDRLDEQGNNWFFGSTRPEFSSESELGDGGYAGEEGFISSVFQFLFGWML